MPSLSDSRSYRVGPYRTKAGSCKWLTEWDPAKPLYRDVFFHVTPLSLYLIVGLTKVFAVDIIVFKLAVAVVFAGIVLLACRINEQLGTHERYSAFFVLALFVFSSPATVRLVSFYSQCACFFLLMAFSLFLSWQQSPSLLRMLAVGSCLGLCFASKQNAGAYGFLGLVVATVSSPIPSRVRLFRAKEISVASAAFLMTVALVFAPVTVSGGLPALLDYGFLGLGSVVRKGSLSYWTPFTEFGAAIARHSTFDMMWWSGLVVIFLLPFLAGILLFTAFCLNAQRAPALGVAAFAGAALGPVFPRVDASHLIFATPILIVAIAFGWRQLNVRRKLVSPVMARLFVMLGILPVVLGTTGRLLWPINSVGFVWLNLPHFRWALVNRIDYSEFRSSVQHLSSLPRDGRTFVLSPRAAFYYLATGIRNPTAFDYPALAGFGSHGIRDIESAIKRGEIQYVCVDEHGDQTFRPLQLERFVKAHMIRRDGPPECAAYANPIPAPGIAIVK